jgi:sporulation protein YlmC with PRC-barrel domain
MSRELHIGEDVLAADGSRLGTVERLVVDERAHRVTHVVVDGRLVPAERLRAAAPEGLASDLGQQEFEGLPHVDHDHVGAPGDHWQPPGGYVLENFLAMTQALIGQSPYVPPVSLDTGLEDVHEITEGSPVWSGTRRLGEVEQVLTDDSGNVTELVIRRAGVLGGFGLLPVGRVTEVVGNNVHTDLEPGAELPDHEEP